MAQAVLFVVLLGFMGCRPFICSVAYPQANLNYSSGLLVFLVVWVLAGRKNLGTAGSMGIAAALLVAGLILSLSQSPDKIAGALTLSQYLSGLLLLLVCQNLSRRRQDILVLCLVMTGAVIGLFALYQFFIGLPGTLAYMDANHIVDTATRELIRQRRVFSPFITPNVLGGYLILIIPLAFAKKEYRPVSFLLVLALLLTRSLGAIVSLGLMAVLYCGWNVKTRPYAVWSVLALVVLAGGILFLRAQTGFPWFQPLFSLKMRCLYWMQTLAVIRAHPWTGTGLGYFDLANGRYSHNSYLQIWAEAGIVTIMAIVALVGAIVRAGLNIVQDAGRPAWKAGALVAIGAFFIHNLVDFTLLLPETGLIGAAVAGLLLNKSAAGD